MRLATFNMESFGGDRAGDSETEARLAPMRERLVSLDPDILCLQEVNGQRPVGGGERVLADLDALLEGTPLADFHRVSAGPDGPVGDRHNLVTLSRLPVTAHRSLRHDLVPPVSIRLPTAPDDPVDVRFDRPVLQACLALADGRTLEVFNAHLRAPLAAPVPGEKLDAHRWRSATGWAEGYHLAALKRTGQALEIRHAIDLLLDADPRALIAVAGDLNADLFETPLRMLMAPVDETETPDLADRALAAAEMRVPAERRHSALHAGRRQLLDHILMSQALAEKLAGVDIENDALIDDTDIPNGFRGSLHAPVWADLDL
ncbi:endonuclease/exonuclease/phosphatase family protein [Amorphus coralli]|uniref:endonuclease/exonuclease/phosphatase family protein n=1 Tax=Amorphus coralli TaxID=340680 RepID=UPI0003FE102C|nr:endonuclease/exonuclease/phosphatase family protein [Amorphus coralli]